MTEQTRRRIVQIRGAVPAEWESLLDLDPTFAEAFAAYLASAYESDVLPAHVRELLLLAHDASVTVRDVGGVELRVRRALEFGATEREVLDILFLLPFIAIHGLSEGLPLVLDRDRYGVPDATRGAYWAAFEERFPGVHGMMAAELPRFFDAYRNLGEVIWRQAELEPRWRELALVVADMSATHLFTEGAAIHIQNALRYGATKDQVVAALALTTTFASTAVELGVRAIASYRARNR